MATFIAEDLIDLFQSNSDIISSINDQFDLFITERNKSSTKINLDINFEDDINKKIKIKIDAITSSSKLIFNSKIKNKITNTTQSNLNLIKDLIIKNYTELRHSLSLIKTLNISLDEASKTSSHTITLDSENKIKNARIILLQQLINIDQSYNELILLFNNSQNDEEYILRFKEETALLVKEYENKISNLTEKLEHKIKNYELDLDKFSKSTELFSTTVDAGLKNLADLNERTQNIEIEFSKILGTETEKVKTDLNTSRIALMGEIDSITNEAKSKINEINTAHSDFLTIVSNAGIYKLTENYKLKADEEKKDYKLNMWLTIGAIALAIIATIIVIIIPVIEHWKAIPPVPMDYFTLFARLSISIMFFVLALYTSKQAAKHYECYQENHRTFLQLAALEPFMARMTPDEQKEIRKGLIPSYFNQSADGKFAAKGDEVDLPTSMHAIVNRLIDVVAEKKEPKPAESPVAETKP